MAAGFLIEKSVNFSTENITVNVLKFLYVLNSLLVYLLTCIKYQNELVCPDLPTRLITYFTLIKDVVLSICCKKTVILALWHDRFDKNYIQVGSYVAHPDYWLGYGRGASGGGRWGGY